jgi:hypothetical protein
MSTDFSENALVEQLAIALIEELGWPSALQFINHEKNERHEGG